MPWSVAVLGDLIGDDRHRGHHQTGIICTTCGGSKKATKEGDQARKRFGKSLHHWPRQTGLTDAAWEAQSEAEGEGSEVDGGKSKRRDRGRAMGQMKGPP